MIEHAAYVWVLLAAGAVLIGVSKTALPGLNTLSIAVFAAFLPAKSSTGAVLVLLLVGDIFALSYYRRSADLRTLLRLIPMVLVGVLGGVLFLQLASDRVVRLAIGTILMIFVIVALVRGWWLSRRPVSAAPSVRGKAGAFALAGLYGSMGGFTTMVANAGGPVMSLYFLLLRLGTKEFLGTAAWFFASVNLLKLPFSIQLGLIDADVLQLVALLIPAVVLGALTGRWLALKISQRWFERIVLILTVVGSVYLILA